VSADQIIKGIFRRHDICVLGEDTVAQLWQMVDGFEGDVTEEMAKHLSEEVQQEIDDVLQGLSHWIDARLVGPDPVSAAIKGSRDSVRVLSPTKRDSYRVEVVDAKDGGAIDRLTRSTKWLATNTDILNRMNPKIRGSQATAVFVDEFNEWGSEDSGCSEQERRSSAQSRRDERYGEAYGAFA